MSEFKDDENRRVDASIGELRPSIYAVIESPADFAALRQQWARHAAVPVIAENRDEGIDHSWADLDVRTMLRGEQSEGRFAAYSVVLAPGVGLPAHYYEDTHTYLVVADGEVELGVGNVVDSVGKHSLGFVPPRTRQSFRNTSERPVELVIVHSPAGAERAFEAAHDHWTETGEQDESSYHAILSRFGVRFDDTLLENDGKTNYELPPVEFEFTGHGDLERLREKFLELPVLPRLVRTTPDEYDSSLTGATRRKQLLNGDTSGGNAMLNLVSGPPGLGAPPHHQPTEEEFFFITGGQLELTCATETNALTPGAFAFCPRNCTHGFNNKSDAEAQFVTLNSPAGHERTMAEVHRMRAQGATKEALHDLSVAGGFVFHSIEALG
ncbi:cupin domain-containing protein [Nocardia sp. bgisy134]|uniref:cupin domain-containing protein n=1 Tax=Nocardia sp. bgisy134 TaxID=3413789 RepID=UPI003D75F496